MGMKYSNRTITIPRNDIVTINKNLDVIIYARITCFILHGIHVQTYIITIYLKKKNNGTETVVVISYL